MQSNVDVCAALGLDSNGAVSFFVLYFNNFSLLEGAILTLAHISRIAGIPTTDSTTVGAASLPARRRPSSSAALRSSVRALVARACAITPTQQAAHQAVRQQHEMLQQQLAQQKLQEQQQQQQQQLQQQQSSLSRAPTVQPLSSSSGGTDTASVLSAARSAIANARFGAASSASQPSSANATAAASIANAAAADKSTLQPQQPPVPPLPPVVRWAVAAELAASSSMSSEGFIEGASNANYFVACAWLQAAGSAGSDATGASCIHTFCLTFLPFLFHLYILCNFLSCVPSFSNIPCPLLQIQAMRSSPSTHSAMRACGAFRRLLCRNRG
jgi:hypothetical protein